jgi:hypothetical protein
MVASLEEEERPPLKAVTEQRDWGQLKSDSGQLSGVYSKAAPSRTEAAEQRSLGAVARQR